MRSCQYKIFSLAVLALLSVPLTSHAQVQPTEKAVAETIKNLQERSHDFRARAETLRNNIQNKRTYLTKLKERLSKARSQTDEKLKAHQLSRFSYQVFLVSTRIAADEHKLQATTALIALIPQLNTGDALSLVKRELIRSAAARRNSFERILREAETYRAAITEETFKAQFEQLIRRTQEQGKGGDER